MKVPASFQLSLLSLGFCVVVAMVASSVPVGADCLVPPSDLVSWWTAEGSVADQTGGNSGTMVGNVGFATGRAGVSFAFEGNGDAILLGNPVSLQLQDFTIEAWIKRSSTTASSLVTPDAELLGYGFGGYGFGLWNDGRLFLAKTGVGNTTVNAGISDTDFHHIAVTKSGTQVIFYIDEVAHTIPPFSHVFDFSTDVAIGARGDDLNNSFYGKIDELSVYSRPLAAAEIQAIYNAGNAGKCRPNIAPLIIYNPADGTVFTGGNATFEALVAGDSLSYQWLFNGTDLSGAVTNPLVLTNISPAQAGSYSLLVSNALNIATSSDAILTVNPAPPCSILTTGLVSWWKGEGNSIDTLGPNDGTNVGSVSFPLSQVGRGFSFDGNGDAVRLGNPSGLQLQNFTIEAWVRRYSTTQSSLVTPDAELLCYGQNGYGFGMWYDGRLFLAKVGVNSLFTTFAVSDTNFHHVVVTKIGAAVVFYIDGVAEAAAAYNPTFTFSTPVAIGARGDNLNNSFYGQIDDLAVYSRALSAAEVQAIYVASVSGKCIPNVPPAILTQPTNQTVHAGTNVVFIGSAYGVRPLSYQWLKDEQKLPGATNSSLTLSNVQPDNAGVYTLQATNIFGVTTSSNATLKVVIVSAFGNGQPLTNAVHSFNATVTVQLQNAYASGLIFYTLDSSPPTFASSQYTGSFVLSNSVVLRALGYSADFFQSGELEPITILLPPSYSLTIGSGGGGSVSANPATGPYLSNTVVNLTATPSAGWRFLQWLGDASGSNPVIGVTMNRPKSLQAVFGTTLGTTAAGSGSVALSPSGGIYPFGTIVQLTGIPNAGNQFALWGNGASGNVNPLSFTVTNANPIVSSLFAAVPNGQAALTVVPVGLGQVNVSPRANAYATGAIVAITATPNAGQSFAGWSGDVGGAQNPLSVTMNQNKLIYANFTAKPRLSGGIIAEDFRLTLTGDFLASYQLESSTNLVSWSLLVTLTNTTGTVQFTDSTGTNAPQRYYRARKLP